MAAGKPPAAGDRLQPFPSGRLHFRRAGKGRPSLQTGPWARGGLQVLPRSFHPLDLPVVLNVLLPQIHICRPPRCSVHMVCLCSACTTEFPTHHLSQPLLLPAPSHLMRCSQASRLSIQTWVTSLTARFLSLYWDLPQPLLPLGDPSVPVGLPVCLG